MLMSGSGSKLSLHHLPEAPGFRCCPSSLYTFRLVLTGLSSGLPFKVSPNLSSSASPVSQTSTQVFLKSAAYAIPPRPRGLFHFQSSIIDHTRVNYTLASCKRLDRLEFWLVLYLS